MRAVSVWFRPDHCTGGDLPLRSLVSWGGGVSDEKRFAVLHSAACSSSTLYVGTSAATQGGLVDGWNHVLFTIRADGGMVAFHDGQIAGSQNMQNLNTDAMNSQHPLVIGARFDANGAYTDYFFGMIQRVQIWDRTLTESDAWADYTNSGGTATDSLVTQLVAADGRFGGELIDLRDKAVLRSTSLVNVALDKDASQSSTALRGVASRAVDGIDSSDFQAGSCSHTNAGANEWWQVDLGAVYDIDTIEVYHRTNCNAFCDAELVGARVYVSTLY